MSETVFIGMIVFVFGLIIGSFLNVCIVRLPKEKSVIVPSSHCLDCQHSIPWYDNIPLLSFIVLRGKCRFCGAPISFRYFLVELLTGLGFLGFYLYFGLRPVFWAYSVMLAGFIIATFIDFEHRIIPDEISIGGMYVGLVFSVLIPALHQISWERLWIGRYLMWGLVVFGLAGTYLMEKLLKKNPPEEEEVDRSVLYFLAVCLASDLMIVFSARFLASGRLDFMIPSLLSLDAAIIGLLIGGGIIYGMGLMGDLIFRKESMGGGDIKLMAMIGAFLGWDHAVLTFFLAPFLGAGYGIYEKIRTKNSAIPYGPFIVGAALISLFWGDQIIGWIIREYSMPVMPV